MAYFSYVWDVRGGRGGGKYQKSRVSLDLVQAAHNRIPLHEVPPSTTQIYHSVALDELYPMAYTSSLGKIHVGSRRRKGVAINAFSQISRDTSRTTTLRHHHLTSLNEIYQMVYVTSEPGQA